MSRVHKAFIVCWAVVAAALAAPPEAGKTAPGDAAIGNYLDRPGLQRLLAEHLLERLKTVTGEERAATAQKLARLYVEFIAKAASDGDRKEWERRAEELLKFVPEAQSIELRTEVAKAAYGSLEQSAERWRLRLIEGEAKSEAERGLRVLKTTFDQLAGEANRRVEVFTRQEDAGRQSEKLSEDLAEAQRLRSVTNYYAGWCGVYLAELSGGDAPALDALKSFGLLLSSGSGARTANLDRLDRGLLRFDHLARSAVGVALANAALGRDAEAIKWLFALEEEPTVPKEVRAQLLGRRLDVLARAKRFADVERAVRSARAPASQNDPNALPTPLEPLVARLLCVRVFEAQANKSGALEAVLSQLGQIGMQDLVARGEVAQVLDLAGRFELTPLGDSGFIVYYVRGIRELDVAEKLQRAAGADPEKPTVVPAAVNQYRQAVSVLDAAAAQPDAGTYPRERARCLMAAGRALVRVKELVRAGERYSEAAATSGDAALSEEALWQAIVALDQAVSDGGKEAAGRLNELIVLYIRQQPQTDRAATLLVKHAGQSGISEAEAVNILLGVGRESTIYESARRQAARLLYRAFRAAGPNEKAFAAQRFVKVGLEVLGLDQQAAGDTAASKELLAQSVDRLVTTARQILDAMLSVPAPDAVRAVGVIDAIEAAARGANVDVAPFAAELAFRRFQTALVRDDEAQAQTLALTLRGLGEQGPRFADAALRSLFQRAVTRWRKPENVNDPAAARTVIRLGEPLLAALAAGRPRAGAPDQASLSVRRQVAEAHAQVWRREGDATSRDAAIALDKAILQEVPGLAESLVRLGELAEAAGDLKTALECQTTLVSGFEQSSPEWFKARTESLRLMAGADPQGAADELAVYLVLYPDFGPEPWGSQLRALHGKLPPATPRAGVPAPKGGG